MVELLDEIIFHGKKAESEEAKQKAETDTPATPKHIDDTSREFQTYLNAVLKYIDETSRDYETRIKNFAKQTRQKTAAGRQEYLGENVEKAENEGAKQEDPIEVQSDGKSFNQVLDAAFNRVDKATHEFEACIDALLKYVKDVSSKFETCQESAEKQLGQSITAWRQKYLSEGKAEPDKLKDLFDKWYLKGIGATSLDEKLDCFEQAVKLNPNNILPYAYLASACENAGELDKAIEFYERVIKNTLNAYAHRRFSLVYKQKREFEKAIACRKRAIEIDPHETDDYIQIFMHYMNLGKLDEAFEWCKKIVVIDPESCYNYSKLADCYTARGELSKEIECLEALVKAEPTTPHYQLLANLYTKKGERNKAIECYKKVLEIDPSHYWAHHSLYVLYTKMGMKKEAEEWQRRKQEL